MSNNSVRPYRVGAWQYASYEEYHDAVISGQHANNMALASAINKSLPEIINTVSPQHQQPKRRLDDVAQEVKQQLDTHLSEMEAKIDKAHLTETFHPLPTENKTIDKSVGLKYDSDKPQMQLLSSIAIAELSKVLTFGAHKYAAHNWRNGISSTRLLGAALRHIFAYLGGQTNDPETGLSHIAHAMCCCMFILELNITIPGTDDRYGILNTNRYGSNPSSSK